MLRRGHEGSLYYNRANARVSRADEKALRWKQWRAGREFGGFYSQSKKRAKLADFIGADDRSPVLIC